MRGIGKALRDLIVLTLGVALGVYIAANLVAHDIDQAIRQEFVAHPQPTCTYTPQGNSLGNC